MRIKINGKTIFPKKTPYGELAWSIVEAIDVLDYLQHNKHIILGGDVLNKNFMHTYDSWFYDRNQNQSQEANCDKSVLVAKEYIARYIQKNGDCYYVVFVY